MKATLQELIRQVRSFTIELLAVDKREMYLWSPAGTSNHMIWHAGHSLWVQDVLCVEPLTGASELPEQWAEQFGQNCNPVASQTDWPDQKTIQDLLSKQQKRLTELVGSMRDDQLVVDANNPKDLVGGIIHGLHDEGRHQGEMYLLFKQFNAGGN
ncbi:DinB family protein [bacterium]|nr:DinB family protein [bacterium]